MNTLIQTTKMDQFKQVIPRIRDILRTCSVTGMDSMRHICLYLLSRYITSENVHELNIPEHLSWEKMFKQAFEDEDISLELFRDELINQFDTLFKTNQFTFDVKSGVKHKEILELLNNVNLDDVDLNMDILGYVYEQHLKTGSSAARDLGQFFTDRFICEYMVKLCNPKFKYPDTPESICDPTMGTGGFLTAYLKHFKGVDWSKHQNQIHGVDHDAKVAGVARLNMFIESGGQLFKHLNTADSLHGGLNPSTYDIILGNMPFGLKGLKYADIHSSVKKLGLNGTKSEPLFLQLMMVSLNKNGRCAVVVPDGMLVNNSKCHNGTRKYLLEHFELKRVIKMKGKFFMNTGIQPSILFFQNSGKKTEEVEFWDVERDDKGNFSEKVVVSVPFEKFDESYSLDMRKYQEAEKKEYSEDFQIVKFGDLYKKITTKTFNSKDMDNSGEVPFYNGSWDSPKGKHSQESYTSDTPYFVAIKGGGGDHNSNKLGLGMLFSVTGPCAVTGANMVFVKKETEHVFIHEYIKYYMKHDIRRLRDKAHKTTNLEHLSLDAFLEFEIPLPPIEVQRQIVEEVDTMYESKQNASIMIENLKKQMKSIVKSIEYKNYESFKLSDLVEHKNGKPITGKEKELGGEYNVMGGGMDYNGTYSAYNRDGQTISISKSGASAGFVKYHNSKYWAGDCFTITPSNDKTDIKYLYYYLKSNQELTTLKTSGSTIPHCKWDDVNMIEIPVPPLEVQTEIVKHLDKLYEQVSCLEAIEEQADDNSNFILSSFLSLTTK